MNHCACVKSRNSSTGIYQFIVIHEKKYIYKNIKEISIYLDWTLSLRKLSK